MRATVLFIIVLFSIVNCHEDISNFLEAFPNGDLSAFDKLPKEAFVNEDLPPFVPQFTADCPSIPAPPDTNDVNNLRPGNIKVVMGMGDSITAAMSAKDTSVLNLREYRGLAFCMGADQGLFTLPNILSQYSPKLVGASTGIGTRPNPKNGLNGAVSGAVNKDMLAQAQWLVNQLKFNSTVNIEQDWKLLTIWIGSNNLCAVCNNEAANNGQNYEEQLTSALTYLFRELPRLFVNLVAPLDISTLYGVNGGACSLLHSVACSCVGTNDAIKRAKVSAVAQDYIARSFKIAKQFNDRKSPTQAVVVQPFLTKNIINERSLLSPADCFHPSASAHALAATALWNNMLTPAASKKTSWDAKDTPICATSQSILYTN